MKRPFFYFAIFLSVLILVFRFFVKEDKFPPGHISTFVTNKSQHLAIKGNVISAPYYKYTYFRKAQIFIAAPSLVRVSNSWLSTYGNIYVASFSDKKLKYGDEVLFEANLKAPSSRTESLFDYKRYLAREGIYALAAISKKDPVVITGNKASPLKSLAYKQKDLFKRKIEYLFKAPERYLLYAILLGERQHIPEDWKDAFIKTQTMHLLAISGLHVGIITFIIFFSVGIFGIPRNERYIITILLLLFYAVIIGFRPSIARATVMGVVILGSYLLKRDNDIYNSLGLAASLILIYNPDQLFNYGFILSFASVLSIIYMTPHISRLLGFDKIKTVTPSEKVTYYFFNLASASLAVWVGLLPLAINFFNIISPVSVVVNILAIPLLFIIIALSVSALIFHMIFPFLGVIFAEAAEFFIATLLSSLRFFSELPFAYFKVSSMNVCLTPLYYLIIIFIFTERKRRRQYFRGR